MRRSKRKLRRRLNIFGFTLGSLLNFGFSLVIILLVYNITIKAFNIGIDFADSISGEKPSQEVTVTLKENSKLREVSKILEEQGLVKYGLAYEIESILKGNNKPFTGGNYVLNKNMDTSEINYALRNSKEEAATSDIKITIIEGRNIREIGQYLESKEIVKAEDFINACNTLEFDYEFLKDIPERENKLEGYLFPDTYFITKNADSKQIINKMLTRFEQIYYDGGYADQAAEKGLTMDQVITTASIIEKEINNNDELKKAASVIYNRIASDMKLQMCSTIIYILDKRKDRLSDEDLKVKSPYNTYENAGLPIGPIANPGSACIDAALNPEQSDLLYFVVKNEETGEHFFTNNYDEFLSAKELYNQKF